MDYNIPVLQPLEIEPIVIQKPAEPTPPVPQLYVIKVGDTLTSISELHSVDVSRVWAANPELTDPDRIEPDKPLKIPLETDELAPRPYPAIVADSPPLESVDNHIAHASKKVSTSGNTYTPGQCTWGVKNWRGDIPNGWGNASAWLGNAKRQGWATGKEPRVGAVAWTSGHVALVVGVSGDTVTIKEMNYNYVPYNVRTVDRPASKYTFIY